LLPKQPVYRIIPDTDTMTQAALPADVLDAYAEANIVDATWV
jgi:hypothetical protein